MFGLHALPGLGWRPFRRAQGGSGPRLLRVRRPGRARRLEDPDGRAMSQSTMTPGRHGLRPAKPNRLTSVSGRKRILLRKWMRGPDASGHPSAIGTAMHGSVTRDLMCDSKAALSPVTLGHGLWTPRPAPPSPHRRRSVAAPTRLRMLLSLARLRPPGRAYDRGAGSRRP